jgi:hypothetical protein
MGKGEIGIGHSREGKRVETAFRKNAALGECFVPILGGADQGLVKKEEQTLDVLVDDSP